MSMIEIMLIGCYITVISLGALSFYMRFLLLRGFTLNSTQKSIQNLSAISLLLAFIWAISYLPLNDILMFTLLPIGTLLIFSKLIYRYDSFLLKYKFIFDTMLVFLAIVLWVLS